MAKYIKAHYKGFLLTILSLAFMWLVWLIAQKTVKNEYLLPTFGEILSEFFILFTKDEFYLALLTTLERVALSFIISFILACIFGVLSKLFSGFLTFFKPIISVVRTLPTMAILALLLLYTSVSVAPVIVAITVLFPMMYAQILSAFGEIDQGVLSAVKVFNISKKDKVFKIYLPLIAPNICMNIGSNLSFGVKLIISAEVMAYTFNSLGGLMQGASSYMEVATLSALTLVAVLLGLLIELVFHLIFTKAFKWRKGAEND